MNFPKKIILTGAPGTGKTTILNLLSLHQYNCIHETSREIIQQAINNGIEDIFKENPLKFSTMLLENRISQYNYAKKQTTTLCFFDRGIPDIEAYLKYAKHTIPLQFSRATQSFDYDLIFIFPPWKSIYTKDTQRLETFNEAIQIHQSILETYQKTNTPIYEIPFGTPNERFLYILDIVQKHYGKQS